jgi:hypothetical protein
MGVVAGLVVLGPALWPGSLLNLDLVLTPTLPVPAGIWGLGPELPRRVPYGVVLAWGSHLLSGAAVGKLWLITSVAAACAGAARLVRPATVPVQAGAALLYGLSPFMLTRIGVGHLGVAMAMGLLPWALPALLQPGRRPRAAVLWAAALGLTGFAGGILALGAVAVGMGADRDRRAFVAGAGALAGQLTWIVPGVTVATAGVTLTDADAFATRADGVVGLLGLPAGHGFWRESSQVGGDAGTGVAVLGLVLLALAVIGARALPSAWRTRAAVAAGAGLALAAASALPGVDDAYAAFSRTAAGSPVRESQRWLVLFLVWLAPAAALGAARVGGRLTPAVPVGVALALAWPGLWGVDGRLDPVEFPGGWARMQAAIRRAPGPVLALPWHQYLDLGFADGRRVLNPLPDYLGGDVVVSSNPELQQGRYEASDPREPAADAAVRAALRGEPVAEDLARLGVRWVVLLHEVDWREYGALAHDPGLERAVRDRALDVYRVRAWRGPVVDARGHTVPVHPLVAPLARLRNSGDATWQRAGFDGWVRGRAGARPSASGTLALPSGRGVVWYQPSVLVVLAYVCTFGVTLRALGGLPLTSRVGTVGTTSEKAARNRQGGGW